MAYVDLALAGLLVAASAWLIHLADAAAEDAVRRYGYNVDSGALLYFFVWVYLAPNVAATGFAALSMYRRWRVRWFAQAAAGLGLLIPLAIVGYEALRAS